MLYFIKKDTNTANKVGTEMHDRQVVTHSLPRWCYCVRGKDSMGVHKWEILRLLGVEPKTDQQVGNGFLCWYMLVLTLYCIYRNSQIAFHLRNRFTWLHWVCSCIFEVTGRIDKQNRQLITYQLFVVCSDGINGWMMSIKRIWTDK